MRLGVGGTLVLQLPAALSALVRYGLAPRNASVTGWDQRAGVYAGTDTGACRLYCCLCEGGRLDLTLLNRSCGVHRDGCAKHDVGQGWPLRQLACVCGVLHLPASFSAVRPSRLSRVRPIQTRIVATSPTVGAVRL
jgi:hypothetical protein